jgi:hypothetical protein
VLLHVDNGSWWQSDVERVKRQQKPVAIIVATQQEQRKTDSSLMIEESDFVLILQGDCYWRTHQELNLKPSDP